MENKKHEIELTLKQQKQKIYREMYKKRLEKYEKGRVGLPDELERLIKRFNKVKEGNRTKSETELFNGREHAYNILTV